MKRKVLDVGQCNADHSRITSTLQKNFDVEIHRAHSHDEAIKLAADTTFDLILINRLLDADGTPAMDILNALKTDEATAEVPVMVVSNYKEAQEKAVEKGAVEGFGKAALDSAETNQLLAKYLCSPQ